MRGNDLRAGSVIEQLMADVLVAMHGYDPAAGDGANRFESVVEDRFEATYRVADTLQGWGIDVDVVISCTPGEGGRNGPTYQHMVEQYPSEAAELDIELETVSTTTAENIEEFYRMARERDADGVVSVSSRDHAPRVLREWGAATEEDIPLIAAVGSSDTYAASGMDPFILEGAAFAPFVEAFDEVWDVDPDRYEEAAAEVAEVLQKYQQD